MQKSFRRGRLLLCHTTAAGIVYSVQLMVGIVTNSGYNTGRLSSLIFAFRYLNGATWFGLAMRVDPASFGGS
jgi:hypothetical protein